MDAYERLLSDAMRGDPRCLPAKDRGSGLEIVDPVLGNVTPAVHADQHSWGPSECGANVLPPGGWRDPAT